MAFSTHALIFIRDIGTGITTKNIMKSIYYSVAICVLMGCSSETSERQLQKDLSSEISRASGSKVELVSCKQIQSQKQNVSAVEIDKIEFEGKIKYKDNGFATITPYKGKNNSFLDLKTIEPQPSIYHTYIYHKPIEKGREENIKGTVFYEKTSNGWMPSKYFIKLENPTVK